MAEAGTNPPQTPLVKFFCHKCNNNITHVLEDYTCPTCGCGFIEEVPVDDNIVNPNSHSIITPRSGSANEFSGFLGSGPDQSHVLSFDFFDLLTGGPNRRRRENDSGQASPGVHNVLPDSMPTPHSVNRSGSQPGHQFSFVIDARPRQAAGGGHPHANAENPVENMLYSFLTDLISGLGGGTPGTATIPMLSNLGDYVWGRDGLDAIVTQLMNQMEGTGAPPLPTEKLENLLTVNISQDQLDRKLQCSVCWEDFELNEEVKQLECDHIYHPDCILPWLKLHATCPICRRDFTEGQPKDTDAATSNQTTDDSPLSQLRPPVANIPTIPTNPFNFLNPPFGIVPPGPSNSTNSSTANNSSQPSNRRGSGPGSNLDNLDFDFD